MSFFTNTVVEDVVLDTINKVDKLEEREQKKLLRLFKRTRLELLDRLLVIPEGTFTEQQLNVTLIQVNAAIEAIKQDLKNGMIESSSILADAGVKNLADEVNRFEKTFLGSIQPLNIDRIVISQNSQRFLLNKHQSSIDAYGEGLRAQITGLISQSLSIGDTSQRTVSSLTKKIGSFFLGEEWKINRIVRTELHSIYNYSKVKALESTQQSAGFSDLQKTLFHAVDSRTGEDSKQLKKENPIVDIDKPFVFLFTRTLKSGEVKTDRREFMFPPDRPNDRSILIPYRKAWDS